MNLILFCVLTILVVIVDENDATQCGCKVLRKCYEKMLSTLLDKDEVECIEDAAIGASTLTIFLKAINQFCGSVMKLKSEHKTYEGRNLYEVILTKTKEQKDAPKDVPEEIPDEIPEEHHHHRQKEEEKLPPKPVFIIEAGQEGSSKAVGLALYLLEQLVACEDYDEMIQRVNWVILPCTNPDGLEHSRYISTPWKKNLKPSIDNISYGVDISRNFDVQFGACPKVENGFSPIYPGPFATSENETVFIQQVIEKYKNDAKVYISIRGDGHSINTPYGHSKDEPQNSEKLLKVAGEVAARVNQRTGGLYSFENMTLFEVEGQKRCGHSVDYAYVFGIPLAYEMRVFMGSDTKIISKFLPMPRNYDTSLRNGYFSGIRELYKILTTDKKLE